MMVNKSKKKTVKQENAVRKTFLSDRQKKVLLVILVLLFISVPVIDILRCKAACMKRVKTPYPEIACRYECPWPWQKTE
ncbi:MAG: hypothetical protein V2A70_02045 [Candidatus Omnitrophota bacterium]